MWLENIYFGARLWVWFIVLFAVLCGIAVIIYYYRYKIRIIYWKLRKSEKLIKVFIHYDTGFYKKFWRLIPSSNLFQVEESTYIYDKNHIIKHRERKDVDDHTKEKPMKILVNGKEYNYNEGVQVQDKDSKYPEIHYFFNNPNALIFKNELETQEMTSEQVEEFKNNDLFHKLLYVDAGQQLMMIVMLICIINLLISGFIIAKLMGWIK
jgi:hypothetical protein